MRIGYRRATSTVRSLEPLSARMTSPERPASASSALSIALAM
jgi:hypothetical protein